MKPSPGRPEERADASLEERADARLPLSLKLAYGMPNFAGFAMTVPIGIYMTKFYSDTIGVALGFIALAQVLARALDAITDPLIGWLSDRTRSRFGRRRPWIMIGAPLTGVAAVALFAPPAGITALEGAAWFTVAYMAYYLFRTVYFIPHYAWGPELTSDYHERSSLFAYRDGITLAGNAFAAASPALAIAWIKDRGVPQAEAEREVFLWFAVAMAVLLVLSLAWLCWRVPENPRFSAKKPNPLIPGVRRVLRNRPFRILLICYVASNILSGGVGVLMPFYLQYVLGIENWLEWLGLALLCGYGVGVASLPIWLRLSRRFGKKNVWITTFLFGATCQALLFSLPSFVRGEQAALWVMAFFPLGGASVAANAFLGPSIQADVIDYDELYTGRRREAQYSALWSIAEKFAGIPSAAIPLAVLATLGFQPNVEQTESVQWAIRVLFAAAPGIMAILAMGVAFKYPINERIQRATLAGIEAHRRGESALDPITGRRLAPPDERGLDEDTGWFLDHFSLGELRRALAGGDCKRVLRRDTWLALGVSTVLFIVALLGVGRVLDLSGRPGIGLLMLVLLAGVAITGVCFHAFRVSASSRAATISPEALRAHLAITEHLAQAGTPARA